MVDTPLNLMCNSDNKCTYLTQAVVGGGRYTGMKVTTGIMLWHDIDFAIPLNIHEFYLCIYIVLFNFVLFTTFNTCSSDDIVEAEFLSSTVSSALLHRH